MCCLATCVAAWLFSLTNFRISSVPASWTLDRRYTSRLDQNEFRKAVRSLSAFQAQPAHGLSTSYRAIALGFTLRLIPEQTLVVPINEWRGKACGANAAVGEREVIGSSVAQISSTRKWAQQPLACAGTRRGCIDDCRLAASEQGKSQRTICATSARFAAECGSEGGEEHCRDSTSAIADCV